MSDRETEAKSITYEELASDVAPYGHEIVRVIDIPEERVVVIITREKKSEYDY